MNDFIDSHDISKIPGIGTYVGNHLRDQNPNEELLSSYTLCRLVASLKLNLRTIYTILTPV